MVTKVAGLGSCGCPTRGRYKACPYICCQPPEFPKTHYSTHLKHTQATLVVVCCGDRHKASPLVV